MSSKTIESLDFYSKDYLHGYLAQIPEVESCAEVFNMNTSSGYASALHTANPSLPAREILANTEISQLELARAYIYMRDLGDYRSMTRSMHYSRRLMVASAESLLDTRFFESEDSGPETLEVHATKGSCDYSCQMCLWSDKTDLTYKERKLDTGGLMSVPEWCDVIRDAAQTGTKRVIFSGGGEPLLNKDIFTLSHEARKHGMSVHLYTNGYGLRNATEPMLNEVLSMEQIRFSVHSPYPDTYDHIVKMPAKNNTLPIVMQTIKELLARKHATGSATKIGIGMVVQSSNSDQVVDMVEFAAGLGVDFLNLRRDEVEVDTALSEDQQLRVAEQLKSIRQRYLDGEFGELQFDMSDEMTAAANSVPNYTVSAEECVVKAFRPAISPYGIYASCDLKAEPRFANKTHSFGNVRTSGLLSVINSSLSQKVSANCSECMPSGKTINAVASKLILDNVLGISRHMQAFSRPMTK